MAARQVNFTVQWNHENEEENIDEEVVPDLDMIRVQIQGDLQVYEYPRQVFIEHLQAHFKMHILYRKIARQLPNGIWILCDDPAIFADYTAFALREMNTGWKTCSMHCYTADQYENFMEPGLRLDLPPDTSAEFLEEVKQCIQATMLQITNPSAAGSV
jgi:hypothetical protein